MIKIEQIEFGKIPESNESFFLIRQDSESQIILERYTKNEIREWDSSKIHEFKGFTPYDKQSVLKQAEFIVGGGETIYIEDFTFWEETF